jgi:acyl carrier protein/polyketide biosynthesis acyl carrier protein
MTRTELFDVLKKNMKAVIPGLGDREITPESSLVKDYGADSLQVVEIVSRTLRAANVRLKRTELNRAQNLGALLDMLSEAARSVHEVA